MEVIRLYILRKSRTDIMEKIIAEKFIDHIENEFNSGYYTKTYKNAQQFFDLAIKIGFNASWSLGGTWGNCWGEKDISSPDVEPEMKQFDDFLIKNFPQVSYMQYKIISRKIQTQTSSSHDYYGGSTQQATKNLSFNDLHDALLEAKVVPDTDNKVNFTELLKQRLKESFMTDSDIEKEKTLAEQKKSIETDIKEVKIRKKYKT